MNTKRYFILAIILLIILGSFLTMSIINGRHTTMKLIKEEARSLLLIVAIAQENSIFAEGQYEDAIVEKLINLCQYIETTGLNRMKIYEMRQSFGISMFAVINAKTKRPIIESGNYLKDHQGLSQPDKVYFDYFMVGNKKYMRFQFKAQMRIYYMELPAVAIQRFRQEFGINKIINQISSEPRVRYLVLQDEKGIIFATPNIQSISRIKDDSLLIYASEQATEVSRFTQFSGIRILEMVRPFVVEQQNLGLFRIGISLDSYYSYIRTTERQLILLFIILFGAGFVFFFLFLKYQSYMGLKEVFHKILDAVEDAVLMVDSKGFITGLNNAFSTMSAIDEQTLIGKNYYRNFTDDIFDIRRVLKSGAKIVDEKKVFDKNIQYATYPLVDRKGNITGAISVLRDVSKLREFEKEREEAEHLKFLGNLVANFAHEIKNPLNGLSIATQRLIKEFPSESKEYTTIVTTLKKEIESLNKTLNDFLSLARPKIKNRVELDLAQILDDTVDLIKEQAKTLNIHVKREIDRDIKIYGNANEIKRAVLNILLNAVEAVSAVTQQKREIKINLKSENSARILLKISDNGSGMSNAEKQRIFKPYFTTKQKGTGLGLYIARKIINDHNGKITIETKKGIGTTFIICIEQ